VSPTFALISSRFSRSRVGSSLSRSQTTRSQASSTPQQQQQQQQQNRGQRRFIWWHRQRARAEPQASLPQASLPQNSQMPEQPRETWRSRLPAFSAVRPPFWPRRENVNTGGDNIAPADPTPAQLEAGARS